VFYQSTWRLIPEKGNLGFVIFFIYPRQILLQYHKQANPSTLQYAINCAALYRVFLFLPPARRSNELLLYFLKVTTNEIVYLAPSATVKNPGHAV